MIILAHHSVAFLLAKMLCRAPFWSMCTLLSVLAQFRICPVYCLLLSKYLHSQYTHFLASNLNIPRQDESVQEKCSLISGSPIVLGEEVLVMYIFLYLTTLLLSHITLFGFFELKFKQKYSLVPSMELIEPQGLIQNFFWYLFNVTHMDFFLYTTWTSCNLPSIVF